ncbi:MAG: class II fumarate hydratase, partial [Thermodesulfobacteriota bacterium]
RDLDNFPISGRRLPREFIRALGLIKEAAAQANMALGLLDNEMGEAIVRAAREVAGGQFDHDFVVDVYQTGSGTSTNMNANEVISHRANEILGAGVGAKAPVHPNDHVNMSQSSNDVIPSAIHVSALDSIEHGLIPALRHLQGSLQAKAREFRGVLKIGRTHLQDAVPVRLGQEFAGYAAQIRHGVRRIRRLRPSLSELALGGTAVGTGINAPKGFAELAIERISEITGIRFARAANPFEAIGARDALVETSGQLKAVAVGLMKISNDLRWMNSGPRCGLGEITLPALQPGSSIMPGKVNPVIPEAIMMLCATVMGHDVAITIGAQHGNFELNTMMPMMADHLLESIRLLTHGARILANRCVTGVVANEERTKALLEGSLAMVTALAPIVGYDEAAEIAQEASASGKTVRQVARERHLLPEEELNRILDPLRLTEPGIPRPRPRR